MTNQLKSEIKRLALNIAQLLSGDGGLPPGIENRTQFKGYDGLWHGRFMKEENPSQGFWRYWVQMPGTGSLGDDGAYIELKNPRPDPDHDPRVEFGQIVPIGQKTKEHSDVETIQNTGKTPLEFERESERTKSWTTSDDVGASLTIGFKQKIGNDETFASAEFEQSVTASYNKHMESSLGGTETVSVSGTVAPGCQRRLSRLVERTRASQTNKVSGILDCEIYIHAYWWWTWNFSGVQRFIDTISGHGKDWWGLEHDLAAKYRVRPADKWARDLFKDRVRISYEETVEINSTTSGQLIVGENKKI